ncbi:PREDICTED: serine/threonine-protein kinase/endoribonuclease IRE1a [Nelumbo nucifera]|uniref:non-specific serine/threonine protein kinase n=2 Tax=Nelumbo nucifera TaxID=4432 RepID=A0A1U8AT16_NELNU|nr:PREDICTED: serine/threonine-protein kinase/endoribonuclease IRE1a [Nelumbo nucifera]DAD41855.1 TPA_asm: hypothetical protein HUJ06_016178 [Nelumbo nucifera]
MKPYLLFLLWFLLIITGFSASIGDSSISKPSGPPVSNLKGNITISETTDPLISNLVLNGNLNLEPFQSSDSPEGRTLLSLPPSEDAKELFATMDGMIHLVDIKSRKVLWSIDLGQRLFTYGMGKDISSDVKDDWEFYVHRSFSKQRLEEILKVTPQFLENGAVLVGSKTTIVYVLDVKTGQILDKVGSPMLGVPVDDEQHPLSKKDIDAAEVLLITRTGYEFMSHAIKSNEALWLIASSIIEAGQVKVNIVPNLELFEVDHKDRAMASLLTDADYTDKLNAVELSTPSRTHYEHRIHTLPEGEMLSLLLSLSQLLGVSFQSKVLSLPSHPPDRTLPLPAASHNPLQHMFDKVSEAQKVRNQETISSLTFESLRSIHYTDKATIGLVLCVVGIGLLFFLYRHTLAVTNESKLGKQSNEFEGQIVVPKRKKARKSGHNKNTANIMKSNRHMSSESEDQEIDGHLHSGRNENPLLNLMEPVDSGRSGRRIGKLLVSNVEIAKGSNGTVVFEGVCYGRPVAIKRLLLSHHDVAFKEIQNLTESDSHPNIVRLYRYESDDNFVYLALERCTCSLSDLIQMYSDFSPNQLLIKDKAADPGNQYHIQLHSLNGLKNDVELWKGNGYPSSQLLKLMRDIVSGLAHLHELGIIHRDLKPQNVLIIKERFLYAKLSDMGISKRLPTNMSSLGHQVTGCGSSGWQAPEQLLHRRQTRAVDLFSLGCVLFYCVSGGRHPFGDHLERDINIVKNRVDLFPVEHIPEAMDLFSHLLDFEPELRPKALEVLHHPVFWDSEMRLFFLRDTSDRVELEDRANESDLLKALESIAPVALNGKWDDKMEAAFIRNIGHYRRYKFDSIRDLLRVIRNKLNHYRELPKEIQEILGPIPEGFDGYFSARFPKLLIEVYKVVHRYCREEECFSKYFKSSVV